MSQGVIKRVEPSSLMLPVFVCALTHLRSLQFRLTISKISPAARRASNMPTGFSPIVAGELISAFVCATFVFSVSQW